MKKYGLIVAVVIVFAALVFCRTQDEDKVPGTLPARTSNTTTNTSPTSTKQTYKDGTYTGSVASAYFYGNVQVQVVIKGAKITDVTFLQYPNQPGHTMELSQQVMPILRQEAITAQSAQVDAVSGASQTSQAFQQSLSNALSQAI